MSKSEKDAYKNYCNGFLSQEQKTSARCGRVAKGFNFKKLDSRFIILKKILFLFENILHLFRLIGIHSNIIEQQKET